MPQSKIPPTNCFTYQETILYLQCIKFSRVLELGKAMQHAIAGKVKSSAFCSAVYWIKYQIWNLKLCVCSSVYMGLSQLYMHSASHISLWLTSYRYVDNTKASVSYLEPQIMRSSQLLISKSCQKFDLCFVLEYLETWGGNFPGFCPKLRTCSSSHEEEIYGSPHVQFSLCLLANEAENCRPPILSLSVHLCMRLWIFTIFIMVQLGMEWLHECLCIHWSWGRLSCGQHCHFLCVLSHY